MNENTASLERCPICRCLVVKGHHGPAECKRLAAVRGSMRVERYEASEAPTEGLFKRYLMYNGKSTLDYHVPSCKITFCTEKATQDCVKCGDPICNGHASFATDQRICHYCRLIDWVQIQKG